MDFFELAKQLSALGATGVLAYIYFQWQSGKIHSDAEVQKMRAEAANAEKQLREDSERDREYREGLRKEIKDDRRAADQRVADLTLAIRESNELTKRALDFNERLLTEMVSARRGRMKDVPREDA